MYLFGSGALIGTPSGTNQTPVNFGLIQELTYDEASTTKPLYGQGRRALAIGAGTIKATGKAKMAKISGLAIGALFAARPTPHSLGENPDKNHGLSDAQGARMLTESFASTSPELSSIPGASTRTN